jgi:hypothetical protein
MMPVTLGGGVGWAFVVATITTDSDASAGTHYMFRPTHLRNSNMNFGHLFIDDILSAYIAMQATPSHSPAPAASLTDTRQLIDAAAPQYNTSWQEFGLEGEGGAADGRFVTVGARNWETGDLRR